MQNKDNRTIPCVQSEHDPGRSSHIEETPDSCRLQRTGVRPLSTRIALVLQGRMLPKDLDSPAICSASLRFPAALATSNACSKW